MMGLAQYDVDVTVGKGTGAMLAFAGDEEKYVACLLYTSRCV